jgi:hypothetical protein
LRPLLHKPYDPDLFAELNVERFEWGKTGRFLFSNPAGTLNDRFWSLALAVYSSEVVSRTSKPIAMST